MKALFEVLDLMEHYPEYSAPEVRIDRTADLNALMNPLFQSKTTEHWLSVFEAAGVPVASIRDYEGVAADPQLATRPVFTQTDLGGGDMAQVVSAAHTTSVDQPVVQGPAPDLGGDTDQVLHELGFGEQQIADWRSSGAI